MLRPRAGTAEQQPNAWSVGPFTYHDVLLFVVGAGLIVSSNTFADLTIIYPLAGWMTALSDAAGIAIMAAALMRLRPSPRYHTYIFVLSLAVIGCLSCVRVTAGTPLPSDEVGINRAAAHALISGHNPYTTDYLKTDPQIAAQPSAWFTSTFSGQRVKDLAYPAGNFLVIAPLVAIAGVDAVAMVYPLLFLLSVVIGWLMVPQHTRPLITVLLYLMAASGAVLGYTDAAYLPFVLLAVWRWPRFVTPEAGRIAAVVGPLSLGVACSIKQNAWVLAPFLVVAVVLEARARKRPWLRLAVTYTALALVPFAALNLPFILADGAAWFHSITLPFTLHTILNGNGISAIPLAAAAGGDHLELLGAASIVVLVATFIFLGLHFPRARAILPLLPIVALTVSSRSISGYLYFLLVPAMVCAATVGPVPPFRALPGGWERWLRASAAAASLVAAALVAFVLLATPPLELRVASSDVTGSAWNSLDVVVTNHSGRSIDPNFYAAPTDVAQFTLVRESGPDHLPAGATAMYRLRPLPNDHEVKPGSLVRIVALADQPESLSQSGIYQIGVGPVGS